jgi:hypothetical protein
MYAKILIFLNKSLIAQAYFHFGGLTDVYKLLVRFYALPFSTFAM